MKRFLSILIASLMILGVFASCGEQQQGQPVSSENPDSRSEEPSSLEEPTEPDTEPESEIPAWADPASPIFEYEYIAPADGSFTICGIPLSDYTIVLYFPTSSDYSYQDRKLIVEPVTDSLYKAAGTELDLKIVKNDKYNTQSWAEHEILFGNNFQREGMPEKNPKSSYYGVTANGTVYFCSLSPMMYSYLWDLFLAEFFGVPVESRAASGGCALTECYREIPKLDEDLLKQLGYSPVFRDEFEGDSLDWTVWTAIDDVNRCGYSCKEQAKVYDGQLHLMGNYVTDGEHGEGWYGCDLKLNQWYSYGYFKSVIRTSVCKERSQDFWSAFWIQGPSPYDPVLSHGGIGEGGAELDIMENFGYDYTSCCFWVAGYEGTAGLDGTLYGALHEVHNLGTDYSEDFHTYALLWDESYYRVYVDDILIACTHFGYGTSHVPEEVRLSLEVPKGFNVPQDTVREMTVESIEIWQKP